MSVEFDSTHQSCCCCEPLNLEQHCCAIILASLPALMHAILDGLPFSTCNIESEQSETIVLSLLACAANAMQRAEGYVL